MTAYSASPPKIKFMVYPELGPKILVPEQPILRDGTFNVMLIVRGASSDPSWAQRTGMNAVIVAVEAGGKGSSENRAAYGKATWVNQTIDSITAALRVRFGNNVRVGNVGLASFSGGYDAVNQILQQRSQLKYPIASVMMFDGMHHSVKDMPDGSPNPEMKAYIDYAREAMTDPSKKFIIMHSAIPTERSKGGYPSTTQTADYILRHVGLQRQAPQSKEDGAVKPVSFAGKGGFEVYQMFGPESAGQKFDSKNPSAPGTLGQQHTYIASLMPEMFKDKLSSTWAQGKVNSSETEATPAPQDQESPSMISNMVTKFIDEVNRFIPG